MAGERKVTTNQAGAELVSKLNDIAVHCDSAIDSLSKLGYRFPSDLQSATHEELDGNDVVRLIRNTLALVDEATEEYKRTLSDYLIAKVTPPKQPE